MSKTFIEGVHNRAYLCNSLSAYLYNILAYNSNYIIYELKQQKKVKY